MINAYEYVYRYNKFIYAINGRQKVIHHFNIVLITIGPDHCMFFVCIIIIKKKKLQFVNIRMCTDRHSNI